MVLVVRPGADGLDAGGAAIALAGATMSATAYVTVRELSRSEHALVIVFYFPLVATPLALPWAIAGGVVPDAQDLALLVAIGAATQVGQVFLTMGLALERAGRATAVGYLQVAFAMVWQLAVFGVEPAWTTIAGASLIIAGTLAVTATSAPGSSRTST